jgi:TRAP-type C4-dicarboxylate transport system substrate-binding protein
MSDLRLAAGIGATIISKKQYDKLPDEHKDLLREITRKYHEQLANTVREKNEESIGVLREEGIEVIHVPLVERERWSGVARQVQDQFAGRLYPRELLDEVRNLLNEYNTRQ